MERHGDWTREGEERQIDLVTLQRMEREVDTTVTRVCRTCSQGWIQRLEDHAKPVLESMITGEPTPLPPVRSKLLARWAAKTAVIMEFATDTPNRTPRSAREHLRNVGVHPGTQVLAGHYEGRLHILSHERDVFSTMVDGEKRYASQTSFVIGRLLLQVFAAPWQDTVPELTQSAAEPFIPLIGSHRNVVWPPAVSIDDTRYDVARHGSADETDAPRSDPEGHSAEIRTGRDTTMTTDDVATPETPPDAADRAWHSAGVLPEATPEATPGTTPEISPEISSEIEQRIAPEQFAAERFAAETPSAPTVAPPGRRRRRSRRRLAGALLMLAVLGAVFGWGLNQRASANRWRSHAMAAQARAHAREAQLRTKTVQFRASAATIEQLNNNITALASDRTQASNRPEQLRRIVSAVPAVANGVRHCANAALATVSDALDFAASYPDSTTNIVNGDSANVSKACGKAGAAANTLEGLATDASAK